MKHYILLPLLAISGQVCATPMTVEMTGTMVLTAENSRFFPDEHEIGGDFKLYFEVNADISVRQQEFWEGPEVGHVIRSTYEARGIASKATLLLNGVLMDLNQYSTSGTQILFRLDDNYCLYSIVCQGGGTDQFAVFFGASDYQNDNDPFRLVSGAFGGTLRSYFDNNTFDGLSSVYSNEGIFDSAHPGQLMQEFNYQYGNHQFTEYLRGLHYSSLTSTRVTVPEPGTLALLSLGLLGLAAFRRGAKA